jgi:hypothetical protein
MSSRAEVIALAERLTNIEMRLDDLEARLDEVQRASRRAAAGPSDGPGTGENQP